MHEQSKQPTRQHEKHMCFYLLLFLMLSFATTLQAQQGNPLFLTASLMPRQAAKQASGTLQFGLNLPLHRDSLFAIGAGVHLRQFDPGMEMVNTLTGISMPFSVMFRLTAKSQLVMMFEPILSSDFDDISAEDFRFNTSVFYVRKSDKRHYLRLGLALSKRFSGYQIIPVARFQWVLSPHWQLSGVLPFKPELRYQLNARHQLGVGLGAGNNSFRLSNKRENQYVNTQITQGIFFYRYKLHSHWHFHLAGGYQIIKNKVFAQDQTFPLSIYPWNPARAASPVESHDAYGVFMQVGCYYSIR